MEAKLLVEGPERTWVLVFATGDEVVSELTGDVALADGGPKIHAHAVVARRDGTAMGGHLLEAHVRPTLELVLTDSPRKLVRRHDPATGLALIDLTHS